MYIYFCVYILTSPWTMPRVKETYIYIYIYIFIYLGKKIKGDKGVLIEEIQSMTHKEANSSFELVGFP